MSELGQLSDPTAQGQQRDRERLAEEQMEHDLLAVMQTAAGRRVMHAILTKVCRHTSSAYVPGSFDQTAHRLGVQSVANTILRSIEVAAPALTAQMWAEAAEGARKARREKR